MLKSTDLPLEKFNDVGKLQKIIEQLWMILDDIDTMDDAAKRDNAGFRKAVYRFQQRRHKYVISDGYDLFIPSEI